jgi:hypothetical protein
VDVCVRYIFGSFLSAAFYEQIEIEKEEKKKKIILFCLQNQFEFLKERGKNYETLSCDGNSNCGFSWLLGSLFFAK